VGVTGVGLFLGPNGADPAHVVEHIDYICQLVGPKHVGLGLDSVLLRNSESELNLSAMGEIALKFWPARQYPAGPINFVRPEDLPAIVDGLLARGYDEADVRAVLGGNFMRLAGQVWKPVD
jgi:membrane dipeptidase